MARIPVTAAGTGGPPCGRGAASRPYAAVTVAGGLRVMTTRLPDGEKNAPARLRQIETLLGALGGGPAVIAGDLGFRPSRPAEPRAFREAGFDSARDVTGHGAERTSSAGRPARRVDCIWGTQDVKFRDFVILDQVTVSDHFPLETTLTSSPA
jgi:endonuclease/exonuclease/phosphatase family metal-dependent hydrolase